MLGPILFLQGEKEYSVELKSSDSGNMVRIENRLNALDKAVAVSYTHLGNQYLPVPVPKSW